MLRSDTLDATETIFFFGRITGLCQSIRVEQQHVSTIKREVARRKSNAVRHSEGNPRGRFVTHGVFAKVQHRRVSRAYELDAAVSFGTAHNDRCKLAGSVIWEKMRFAASTMMSKGGSESARL